MVSETGHFTAASLTFLPQPHEYRLPDGRVVPSVTQILKAVGASTDFEALAALSKWRAERIDTKRAIGYAVHADCHAFDDDDLSLDAVHSDVRPYVEAWARFRENSGLVPLTRERRIFHPGFFYAGTLDGIFRAPSGAHVLVDIKTGDPEDSGCVFQTAAYDAAHVVEHPELVVQERWAVQLIPGARMPYRVTNYSARADAWRDFQIFQSFVTTYWNQPCRRKRA